MSKEENKQFMNSFIEEVINRQNLDAIDEKINEVKASYPKNMKPITREKYNAMIEEIANNVLD